MQAAETVYEFGSSPPDDDEKGAQQSSTDVNLQQKLQQSATIRTEQPDTHKSDTGKDRQNPSSSDKHHHQQQQLKASEKQKAVFGSKAITSDSDYLTSDQQSLLLNRKHIPHNNPLNFGPGASSSASNTSLTSSATNSSSRGNINQSANQSSRSSNQQLSTSQQNPSFDSNVISERVKNLATQIYQELKRIISRCNYDEDILSGLMPLIVRVLESLDLALIENQQLQVELELCKDDNEQLIMMFEKEKQAKRGIDKKLIESEYAFEEDRQKFQQKIESLENIAKLLELKSKNASDQAARFEEKDKERKSEYNKLHDRYTELLKSHCDVVERVRHLLGNDSVEVAHLVNMNVPQTMVAASSDLTLSEPPAYSLNKMRIRSDEADLDKTPVMRRELLSSAKSWNAETELTLEDSSLVILDDPAHAGFSSTQPESSSEIDTEHEKDGDKDSIAYTSMEKEFRKLIQENKDLLNTKNALNVVKDDLIADIDRLSNEVTMYEQALEQINLTKDQMKQKISSLDTELRKTKDELEKAKQKIRENNEEGIPYSHRKRFGRAEMAKVLMERNNYKERYMELQDAVKYTELVRANRSETEKRSGIWKFFSNLFGAPTREPLAIGGPVGQTSRNSSPVVPYGSSTFASSEQQVVGSDTGNRSLSPDSLQQGAVVCGGSIRSTNQRLSNNSDFIFLMDSDLNIDRCRAFKKSARDFNLPNYIHAYGWSLSATSFKLGGSGAEGEDSNSEVNISSVVNSGKLPSALQVPIPQYCRPLTGDSLGMKIWCGTAIDMSGGDSVQKGEPRVRIATRPQIIGQVLSSSSTTTITEASSEFASSAIRQLEQDVSQAMNDSSPNNSLDSSRPNLSSTPSRNALKTTCEMVLSALPINDDAEELSSCVWICSTQHSRSKITIIDIKTKPDELLDHFYVPTFIYCIKAIPGAKQSDLLGILTTKNNLDNSVSRVERPSPRTLEMVKEIIAVQKKQFYTLVEIGQEEEKQLIKKRFLARQQPSVDGLQEQSKAVQTNEKDDYDKTTTTENNRTLADQNDAEISRILDSDTSIGVATLQKLNDFVAHTQPTEYGTNNYDNDDESKPTTSPTQTDKSDEGINETDSQEVYYQPISTFLPTVWMGGRDCILYIHSAIGQWKDCVACAKLPDSILQICHYKGRVFVALADGSLCVFMRNIETKQWDFSVYVLIDVALMSETTTECDNLSGADFDEIQIKLFENSTKPKSSTSAGQTDSRKSITELPNFAIPDSSKSTSNNDSTKTSPRRREKISGIRCLEIANKNLWIGYKNRVLILDPITLKLKHTFNIVPQIDNQIRQIISVKDGVFICLRSDLILRLYSSLKPYQHIQNTDIEPIVTRFISPKSFVISHITAMKVVNNTLWIGNAHGIILTIPFKLAPQVSETNTSSEEFEESTRLSIASSVPLCDVTNAQISFHGHKDAIKFFIHSHGLMLSGGQGYLDFRLDMEDQCKSISDKSHLILWQLFR